MARHWERWEGRKKSIRMKAFPTWPGQDAYFWTWNRKWLKDFLTNRLITNLEYFEGIHLLDEIKLEK
jgi:hypothetical protein